MTPKIHKKKAILEAVRRVLTTSAPAAATMDHIAAEAGVAKGTLFLYYPSKEALFSAVYADLMTAFVSKLESVRDSGLRGEELLSAAIISVVEHMDSKAGIMDALNENRPGGACARGPKVKAPVILATLSDILQKCAADGLIRLKDPLYMASALFGLCRGSFSYSRGPGRALPLTEKTARIMDIYLHGTGK